MKKDWLFFVLLPAFVIIVPVALFNSAFSSHESVKQRVEVTHMNAHVSGDTMESDELNPRLCRLYSALDLEVRGVTGFYTPGDALQWWEVRLPNKTYEVQSALSRNSLWWRGSPELQIVHPLEYHEPLSGTAYDDALVEIEEFLFGEASDPDEVWVWRRHCPRL